MNNSGDIYERDIEFCDMFVARNLIIHDFQPALDALLPQTCGHKLLI